MYPGSSLIVKVEKDFGMQSIRRFPACRRPLFPLLHEEKGRATKEIGDVCTHAIRVFTAVVAVVS